MNAPLRALRNKDGKVIGFPYFAYVEPDMTERECPVCGARFVVVMVREPNGGDLKPDNTVESNHWMTRHEPQAEADRLNQLQHEEWHRLTGKQCARADCPQNGAAK